MELAPECIQLLLHNRVRCEEIPSIGEDGKEEVHSQLTIALEGHALPSITEGANKNKESLGQGQVTGKVRVGVNSRSEPVAEPIDLRGGEEAYPIQTGTGGRHRVVVQ